MAKFISVEVSGNASNFLNGAHLIPADQIVSVEQTAAQTLIVHLDTPKSNYDEITLTFSTVNDSAGAVNPVFATGAPLRDAFNYSLTGNPGGVKATPYFGKDDNDDQVFLVNLVYS